MNKNSSVLIVLLVIVIALLAFIAFKPHTSSNTVSPESVVTPNGQTTTNTNLNGKDYQPNPPANQSQPAPTSTSKTFTNSKYGFSIQYPSNFNTEMKNAATADFDGIDTANMFFANFPSQVSEGNNLASVTVFAGAKNVDQNTCYYTLYGNTTTPDDKKLSDIDTTVIKNGITYHMVSSSEGAAGSTYATHRYSTMHNGFCYQVYVVARSANDTHSQSNNPTPTYSYDKDIFPTFNQILNSFTFTK